MQAKNRKVLTLILYAILFYALWSFVELSLKSRIDVLPNAWIVIIIQTGIIKNLVWTLPAIVLISHYRSFVVISLNEMFTTKVIWSKYLPTFAFFTVYIGVAALYTHGKLEISPNFVCTDLFIVLFVGLTEELVFRGWFLNASINLDANKQKWLAISINALMFLLIHFPRWIYEGILIDNFSNLGFLGILALSVIFSQTFIKSRNILVPIALHMYWDLLMFLFV
jgi:CAAX amino terminal protease family.